MTDPLDQPEDDRYEIVYPFVVCASEGGPYDDEAFAAGAQLGHLDQALITAAAIGATRVVRTIRTTLVRQAELAGMARGFPVMSPEEWEDGREWTTVTFTAAEESA